MSNALNYVKATGMVSETSYPYKAVSGTCKVTTGDFKIKGYKSITNGDCNGLSSLASVGPVGVAVDASNF